MAMHYDTNDNLKTSISSVTATDALSPETAYTAYIFATENIVGSIEFTTLAIPTVASWGAESQTTFVEGSLPYRDSQYQVYAKLSEFLLVPFFYNNALEAGLIFRRELSTKLTCNTTNVCLPTPAGQTGAFIEQLDARKSHSSAVLAIQQTMDSGKTQWQVSDGSEPQAVLNVLK